MQFKNILLAAFAVASASALTSQGK